MINKKKFNYKIAHYNNGTKIIENYNDPENVIKAKFQTKKVPKFKRIKDSIPFRNFAFKTSYNNLPKNLLIQTSYKFENTSFSGKSEFVQNLSNKISIIDSNQKGSKKIFNDNYNDNEIELAKEKSDFKVKNLNISQDSFNKQNCSKSDEINLCSNINYSTIAKDSNF